MRKSLAIFVLALTLTSAYLNAASAIFEYSDFGPQAASHELIGYEWYQWLPEGGDDPSKKYDIKVVVYWDEPLKDVQTRYPVDPSKNQDYRYLSYNRACEHLRSLIQKFKAAKISADDLQKTLSRLE